jgi:alpha 1,2-mannosyltransferase
MQQHCPLELADNLVNPDQYKGSIDFWRESVGREVILEKRASLVDWIAGRIESGEQVVWDGESQGKGRGIVMTGGNKVSHPSPPHIVADLTV